MSERFDIIGTMAYQGKRDCHDGRCRQFFGGPYPGTCYGYHCAVCDEPSSMYGHEDCGVLPLDPFGDQEGSIEL